MQGKNVRKIFRCTFLGVHIIQTVPRHILDVQQSVEI